MKNAMPFLHRTGGATPDVHAAGALVVWRTAERHLLRTARLPEGVPTRAGSTLHGDGIRHRNGDQGLPAWREDFRGASTLYPDGQTITQPTPRTLRDGWRTLRFFLLYSPSWLFLAPGAALLVFGLIGYALALPGIALGSLHFDAHTLLFASLALICGFQAIAFFLFAKVFAISEGLLPESTRGPRLLRWINLERGLVLGVISLVAGVLLLAWAINLWRETGFGPLDYSRDNGAASFHGIPSRPSVFQGVLASFFLSVLGLKRKWRDDPLLERVQQPICPRAARSRARRADWKAHFRQQQGPRCRLRGWTAGPFHSSAPTHDANHGRQFSRRQMYSSPAVEFDGLTLPLADHSVDVVLFVDVLHHTADPLILLREAARVARRHVEQQGCTCSRDSLPVRRCAGWIGSATRASRRGSAALWCWTRALAGGLRVLGFF